MRTILGLEIPACATQCILETNSIAIREMNKTTGDCKMPNVKRVIHWETISDVIANCNVNIRLAEAICNKFKSPKKWVYTGCMDKNGKDASDSDAWTGYCEYSGFGRLDCFEWGTCFTFPNGQQVWFSQRPARM